MNGFRAVPLRRALLAAVLALHAGCMRSGGADTGLPAELARQVTLVPGLGPRLSLTAAYRSCAPAAPGAVSAIRGGCSTFAAAGPQSGGVAGVAARAAREARTGLDAGALHASALIDLLYEPGLGKPLQRTISSLHAAARQAERPAPVLADLAAAYLVRAERAHSPRDLLAAIEAAEEALAREPGNLAALYNRALALERFGVVEQAAGDWGAYLAVDADSPWADEARRRRAALQDLPPVPPAPPADALPADFAGYAAADPQGARTLGWCSLLGRWAEAVVANDAESARGQLARAEAVGSALATPTGGDQSLADGVRAIRQARPAVVRRLARAHREFAAGCELEDNRRYEAAARRFAVAAGEAGGSPALRAWARLAYAGGIFRAGQAPAAEAVFRETAARADSVRYPALSGRAHALLAALLVRGDRYEPSAEQARRAALRYGAAGERENEAAALYSLASALFEMRDTDAGWAAAHDALARLRPYRRSNRLHNVLYIAAEAAEADGFVRAAIRLQDEGVRVTEQMGFPVYQVEARLNRARLLALAGALPRADADVAAAHDAVRGLTDDARARGWMTARLQWTRAGTTLRDTPVRAARGLDSAATFFGEMYAPVVALPMVMEAARAWLAAGDPVRGTARLEAALRILERRRDSIQVEPRRAAVFETARTVVDRVTLLRLRAGRTAEALAWMDRGRASLAVAGRGGNDVEDGAVRGPADAVSVEYALVADTLLAWTVNGRRVDLYRTVLDTLRLERTIQTLASRMEQGAGGHHAGGELEQLYDWLVRPIAARLGPAGTPVVVVADGELLAVPFAALRDQRLGRYLIEDHPLRFAASLREARRAARSVGAGQALFVSDPAFDAAAHSGFARLSGAAGEVAEVAGGYRGPRVLAGGAATAPALRAALSRASVLHYAGHAVFDDERPERSYLLLAPAAGAAGTLQADQIARMDLRHVSLVVLSACQTVRTGRGRAAGFSGLAGAFLAAGAGGAVGSLWEVDDRFTHRLMVEFHAAYRASGDGAQALRQAQLRLLRSDDAGLGSPAVWAAFRYTGS